jgi:cation:H+ antiporter
VVNVIWLLSAMLVPVVWLVAHLGGHDSTMSPLMVSSLSGLAIVSSAFLLSWATELAEEYVPASFALIVLALISVLPEYAVDMHFAWMAGKDPTYRAYAVANMTGANRLLIGVGWTMLVFVQWARGKGRVLEVHPGQRLELGFLLVATMYSLVLPLKGTISLIDTAVLFLIFALYVWRSLKAEQHDHPLVGPAAWMAERANRPMRVGIIISFLVYACAAIWFSAEPFAEGLIEVGHDWGVDEFVLIQLVAPLASESPEFIVAILFVFRNRASMALGALVSSKVNQWTLLVGAIPIFYSASRGDILPMELEPRPKEELLLTSAQSLFAVAILSDLRFTLLEAAALLVLFVIPWLPWLQEPGFHYAFSALYFILALFIGLGSEFRRRHFSRLLKLRG